MHWRRSSRATMARSRMTGRSLIPAGSGLLSSFQSGEMAPGAPISVTALRDPLEELRHAAARAQRMLDDGTVDSAEEIGLLLPDDPAWLVDAEAVFANLGLHLGGLPGAPARDRATEALHLILTVLNKPAPGMAAVALDALNLGAFDGELRGLLHRHPATGGESQRLCAPCHAGWKKLPSTGRVSSRQPVQAPCPRLR